MDPDQFVASHEATWGRLDTLLAQVRGDPRRADAAELDEIVRLYLRTSSHLSTVRSAGTDPALVAHLSRLTARASAFVYGSRDRTWHALVRFVTDTFPAAVAHAWRPIAVSAAVFVIAAGLVGVWVATSDVALEIAAPEASRAAYVDEDFEAYYSSQPAAQFAASVFTNNARVGLLAFALGIGLCLPTLWVIGLNGVNVGIAAGIFHAAGRAGNFWGLILPHGLLELTAVFIAGGAGLRLGWALIDPGDRRRAAALADEGRRAVVIVIGLVGVFAIAGVVEAYVTPSGLPTAARVGIGLAVELAFLAYVVVAGRRATRLGLTGALGEHPRPTSVAEVAPL